MVSSGGFLPALRAPCPKKTAPPGSRTPTIRAPHREMKGFFGASSLDPRAQPILRTFSTAGDGPLFESRIAWPARISHRPPAAATYLRTLTAFVVAHPPTWSASLSSVAPTLTDPRRTASVRLRSARSHALSSHGLYVSFALPPRSASPSLRRPVRNAEQSTALRVEPGFEDPKNPG